MRVSTPPTAVDHPDLALIAAAVARDPAAARTLIKRLTPVIQARIARCLVRSRSGLARNTRQEVADLAQDVFRILFEHDGRTLFRWSPDGGLSLENFAGLVAQRHALSVLRSRRRSPWTEDPTEDLERLIPGGQGPEEVVATRQVLDRIVAELEEELSPKGLELFRLLFIDEADVVEICEQLEMSRDAVYAWRSRLGKVVRTKVSVLMSDEGADPRTNPPEGGT
jgi:RNA polymerase sigma-70 factor (ECF subfamily)